MEASQFDPLADPLSEFAVSDVPHNFDDLALRIHGDIFDTDDLTLTFHDESTSSTNASNPVFDYSAEDPQQTLDFFNFDYNLAGIGVGGSDFFGVNSSNPSDQGDKASLPTQPASRKGKVIQRLSTVERIKRDLSPRASGLASPSKLRRMASEPFRSSNSLQDISDETGGKGATSGRTRSRTTRSMSFSGPSNFKESASLNGASQSVIYESSIEYRPRSLSSRRITPFNPFSRIETALATSESDGTSASLASGKNVITASTLREINDRISSRPRSKTESDLLPHIECKLRDQNLPLSSSGLLDRQTTLSLGGGGVISINFRKKLCNVDIVAGPLFAVCNPALI